jgi:hypothetical protein
VPLAEAEYEHLCEYLVSQASGCSEPVQGALGMVRGLLCSQFMWQRGGSLQAAAQRGLGEALGQIRNTAVLRRYTDG